MPKSDKNLTPGEMARIGWDNRYMNEPDTQMPWFYPDLDPDLKSALKSLSMASGSFLDLGTGPGTQAVELAKLGFMVTASDISSTALSEAKKRADAAGVEISFVEDNILETTITGKFDYIFDRGCFHVLPPHRWKPYAQIIQGIIKPGGILFLKCFSTNEPGTHGPYRVGRDDIRISFSEDFEIISIIDTVYQGTLDPLPKALFCIMRRR